MKRPFAPLWRSLNWPNRISLMRIACVAPFVVLLLNQRQWPHARHVAIGVFILMAFSDVLDGYLARKRGQITRLGTILDPLADKVLITCSVLLLASGRASVGGERLANWVVVGVVGKDLWVVVGFLVIFLITGQLKIQPTRVGKLCTMTQLAMVTGVLVAPDLNRLGYDVGSWIARGLGWLVMGMTAAAVISYTRLGVAFLAEAGETGHDKQPHPAANAADETTEEQ